MMRKKIEAAKQQLGKNRPAIGGEPRESEQQISWTDSL